MYESITPLLNPRSIAVIGASRKRRTVGGEIFHNLLRCGFNGPVYPVNPTAEVVQSVQAYPSILETPGPVDLAVMVIPAKVAKKLLLQCAEKGVKAVIVVSAGFKEIGGDGPEREAELVPICRDNDMRLLGPNCLGVLNTDPEARPNATSCCT